jgi:hypothetical protein
MNAESDSPCKKKNQKMGALSNLKRQQIITAPLAGASVTKTATLLGVLTVTDYRVMSAYTNHRNTESEKMNSG